MPADSESYGLFFYFLGILAVRHPVHQHSIPKAILHTGDMLIDIIGETIDQETLDAYYVDSKTPIEHQKRLHEIKSIMTTEKFYTEADNDVVITTALNAAEAVAKSLMGRNWMFVISLNEKFISCDRPLLLSATSKGPKAGPLGFDILHTEVIFC